MNAVKVAIIRSRFNNRISAKLTYGALLKLFSENANHDFALFEVPGAFEIPFATSQLLNKHQDFAGVLTIGAVIKGETAHFEYISQAVIGSLAQISATAPIPVALGLLTTFTKEQAEDRAFTHGLRADSRIKNQSRRL